MSPSKNEDTAMPAEIDQIHLSEALLAPLDSIFKAQLHAARSFLNMLLQLGYPDETSDYSSGDIDASVFKQDLAQGRDIDILVLAALKTDAVGLDAVSGETCIDAVNEILGMTDLSTKVDISRIAFPRAVNDSLKKIQATGNAVSAAVSDAEIRLLNKSIFSKSYPRSIRAVAKGYEKKFQFSSQETNGKKQTHEISIPTLALIPVVPIAVESAEFKLSFQVTNTDEHRQMRKSASNSKEEQKRPWFLVENPISIRGRIVSAADDAKASSSKSSTVDVHVKISRVPMPSGLDRLLTALGQVCNVESNGK